MGYKREADFFINAIEATKDPEVLSHILGILKKDVDKGNGPFSEILLDKTAAIFWTSGKNAKIRTAALLAFESIFNTTLGKTAQKRGLSRNVREDLMREKLFSLARIPSAPKPSPTP